MKLHIFKSFSFVRLVTAFFCLILTATIAVAQTIPGQTPPATQPTKGSVLVFNYYASSTTIADSTGQLVVHDTTMNITNTSSAGTAFVHTFFIDGATGSNADIYYCIPSGITESIRASDYDPDNKGYLIAATTDSNGTPINFNNLTGQASLSLDSGTTATYPALAIEALTSVPALSNGFNATLNFDGVNYSKLPRAVGMNPALKPVGMNQNIVVINNLGRNLNSPTVPLGTLNWLLTNNTNSRNSTASTFGGTQLQAIVSESLVPGLFTLLKGKQTGNLRVWTTTDLGVSGIFIRFRDVGGVKTLDGAGNLTTVTVTDSAKLTIPVFQIGC